MAKNDFWIFGNFVSLDEVLRIWYTRSFLSVRDNFLAFWRQTVIRHCILIQFHSKNTQPHKHFYLTKLVQIVYVEIYKSDSFLSRSFIRLSTTLMGRRKNAAKRLEKCNASLRLSGFFP